MEIPTIFPGKLRSSPGLALAGSSRTHGIPSPCSQDGKREPGSQIPREFGMLWDPEEKLAAQNFGNFQVAGIKRRKERENSREFCAFGKSQGMDSFLSQCGSSTGIHWDPLDPPRSGLQEVRNCRKIRIFMECHGLGGKGPQIPPHSMGMDTPHYPRMLQPPSLDISKDSSGNSSPFQAGIFSPLSPHPKPAWKTSPSQQSLRADFRELCHLQLMGKPSGI